MGEETVAVEDEGEEGPEFVYTAMGGGADGEDDAADACNVPQ